MHLFDTLQSSSTWLPLADSVAKATVLLAAAGLVAALLRKGSAASRHLVWACALVAALALPVLSFALPRWQVPVVTLTKPLSQVSARARPGDAASGAMSEAMRSRLESAASVSADASASKPAFVNAVSWPVLIGGIWAVGTILILLRLAVGIAAVQVMSRRTEVVTDAPWLPLARELAAQLGLSRVAFRRSGRSTMPIAWGVFRPSVLLPAEADTWPRDRLRIVLLHELAHVRRADCLTHILAQAACALYWMNPLAWIAARRLRTERERACDDLVLACGTAGPDYADQLLEIARSMSPGRLSATIAGASLAMARRSQLEGRLMSILDPSVPRTGVSPLRTAGATTLALLTLVPLASLQPWAHAAVVPQVPQKQNAVADRATPADRDGGRVVEQKMALDAAQGATEGTVQGVTQGVVQGVLQGVLQAIPVALSDLEGTFGQNPNPNPNPNPRHTQERSKADPKVVAALTEALKDSDKEVRESALHALVRMRDPGMFEPLLAALRDASADVRESAAFGLGQIGDKRAVAALSAAVKDSAPGVREQAVFALGQLEDPSSMDAVVGALRDENASVREQAAFALGQLDDERAVQPLMAALKDPVKDVRERAVFALGQLGAPAAVDGLLAALKDADAGVRAQAAFALGQIGDPRAVDALTAALKDSDTEVRRHAAFALGQLAR